MVNDDTIKLLNECNAGIKMGVEGIKEVIDNAENEQLIDVLNKYLKDHEKFAVKAGIVDGKVTSEKELAALSKLPNKDGMVSMLLSVLQAPVRGLACAIKAVSEKE